MLKNYLLTTILLVSAVVGYAQSFQKNTYYSKADGLKGQALKTALCSIIYTHTNIGYDGLWDAYKTTDKREDGKVWDMYSCTTDYAFSQKAGSYKKEGDVYNREHSVPQSWFNEGAPMKSDLYHVYPTDGYVNNRRSNYSFGEVGSVTYQSNEGFSKLGSPSEKMKQYGCTESVVFEPNDIYKGDFARTYFYMVTCYENQISSWNSKMFSSNKYPSLTTWAQKMLLDWAKRDQVSKKETDRIEAVYAYQKNRNPFIDFPGLEEYIWGEWKNVAFSVENYVNPYTVEKPETPVDTTVVDTTEIVVPTDTVKVGEVVFYESFDACESTGGNDGKWTGGIASGTPYTDHQGWSFQTCYGANYCIRLGSGSKKGSATTPMLGLSEKGSYLIYFEAAAWGTDADTISMSVMGGGKLSASGVKLKQSEFAKYKVYLTGATNETQITFSAVESSNNRFFLDEVEIWSVAPQETHVESVTPSTMGRVVYDMMGRRVTEIRKPGMYIVNGKKMVVK